jgi:hypothetical protein
MDVLVVLVAGTNSPVNWAWCSDLMLPYLPCTMSGGQLHLPQLQIEQMQSISCWSAKDRDMVRASVADMTSIPLEFLPFS